MPLPVDEQDPIYGQPGVPLDRGIQEAWAKAWGSDDLITSNALECDEIKPDTPKKEHCNAAFLQLATFADQDLHNVQEKTWAAVSHLLCSIYLQMMLSVRHKIRMICLADTYTTCSMF